MTARRRDEFWHTTAVSWRGLAAAVLLAAVGFGCRSDEQITATTDPGRALQLVARAEKVLQDDPDDEDNRAEARALYEEAVRLDPRSYIALTNLGVLYMEEEDFISATDAFGRAAEADLGIAEPIYNIALCYDRRGFAWKALDLYALALERDPRHINSLRGAIRAADRLRLADTITLQRIDLALRVERDEDYIVYFKRQRSRIEAQQRVDDGIDLSGKTMGVSSR